MPDDIDSLQIKVTSTADAARRSLLNLADALSNLGDMADYGVSGLRDVESSMSRIAKINTSSLQNFTYQLKALSGINLDNLKDKTVNIDFKLKGDQSTDKIKYAIDKSLNGMKIDSSKFSKELAKNFNLKGGAASKLKSQFEELAVELQKSFDGDRIHVNDSVSKIFDSIENTIYSSGSVMAEEVKYGLGNVEQELLDFRDWFNKHRIEMGDFVGDVGTNEFKEMLSEEGMLSHVTKKGNGYNVNANWEELRGFFPGLLGDIESAGEQLDTLFDLIRKAREATESVSLEGLPDGRFADEVESEIVSKFTGLGDAVTQNLREAMASVDTQNILNIKVNEDGIVNSIQNAIERATSVEYKPIKIPAKVEFSKKDAEDYLKSTLSSVDVSAFNSLKDVQVDAKSMSSISSFAQSMSGLNAEDMAKIASGINAISGAMSGLGDIDTKSSGLNAFVGSLARLTSVDLSNFDEGKLQNVIGNVSELATVKNVDQTTNKLVSSLARLANAGSSIEKVSTELPKLINVIKNFISSTAASNTEGVTNLTSAISSLVSALARLMNADLSKFDTTKLQGVISTISSLANLQNVEQSISKLVSALARLASSGESIDNVTKSMPQITATIKDFVTGVGSASVDSVSGLTSAFASLANSGSSIGTVATTLPQLTNAVLNFITALSNAPTVSANITNLIQSLASLANAGKNVGKATSSISTNINSTNPAINKFKQTLSGVGNAINKAFSGIKSVTSRAFSTLKSGLTKSVSLIKKLGASSKTVDTATLSFRRLLSTLAPFIGLSKVFSWLKEGVELSSDLTEVENVVTTVFGDMTDEVDAFAKSALDSFGMSELTAKKISSTFQAMGTAMNISSSTIKTASSNMADMNLKYGNTNETLGDMSLSVTKLAADMASFYNMDVSEVAEDLESIYTGTTQPLRQYGIDLTQATLKEWALSQGIDSNISSMTQAEKTMLRYQYVMANQSYAMGDYAKTSDTWANSTTRLGQALKNLGGTVGTALISALKPVVAWLNNFVAAVQDVVTNIVNALGQIFGWQLEITGGGTTSAADALDSAATGADDVASGLGNAADNAEDLKDTLTTLPFDELNQLSDNTSDSGSGSGGSGSGGSGSSGSSGGGTQYSLTPTEGILSKFTSDITTLEGLGEYVGTAIKNGLSQINWDGVYGEADSFGTGLADFLNGLVGVEGLFDKVGETAAGGVNTALHFLDSFGDTFKWDNFGKSLADGLDSFFDTWDADLTADTFDTFANGLVDMIIAATDPDKGVDFEGIGSKVSSCVKKALKGIEWDDVYKACDQFGTGIANFINGLIDDETFGEVGKTVASVINSVVSGAHSFLGTVEWKDMGSAIATSFNTFMETADFKEMGEGIVSLVQSGIDLFSGLTENLKLENFTGALTDLFSGIFEALDVDFDSSEIESNLKQSISNIKTALSGGTGAKLAIGAILTFSGVSTPLGIALLAKGATELATKATVSWGGIQKDVSKVLSAITTSVGAALLGIGAVLAFSGVKIGLGISLMAAGAVSLATGASLNWNTVSNKISTVLTTLTTVASTALLAIGSVLVFTAAKIPLGLGLMATGAAGLVTTIAANWGFIKGKVGSTLTAITSIVSGAMMAIGAVMLLTGAGIPLGLGLLAVGFAGKATVVAANWSSISTKISSVLTAIVNVVKNVGKIAIGVALLLTGIGIPLGLSLIKSGAGGLFGVSSASDSDGNGIVKKAQGMLSDLKDVFKKPINALVSLVKSGWTTVSGWLKGLGGAVKGGVEIATSLVKSAGNWAADAWSAIKAGGQSFSTTVSTYLEKAKSWASDAWTALTSGDVTNTVKTMLKKGGTFVADAFTALTSKGGTKTISTELQKATTWISDAWNALTSKDKTTTISTVLKKATTWISDAFSVLTQKDKSITVTTALEKATSWASEAMDVIKEKGGEITKSVVVKAVNTAGGVISSLSSWWKGLWGSTGNSDYTTEEKSVIVSALKSKGGEVISSLKTWWDNLWDGSKNDIDSKSVSVEAKDSKGGIITSLKTWWTNLWGGKSSQEAAGSVTATLTLASGAEELWNDFETEWNNLKAELEVKLDIADDLKKITGITLEAENIKLANSNLRLINTTANYTSSSTKDFPKTGRRIDATANFKYAMTDNFPRENRRIDTTANFRYRSTENFPYSNRYIDTVSNFKSATDSLNADSKTFGTWANFNNRYDNLGYGNKTFDSWANFTQKYDNISDKTITGVKAEVDRVEKARNVVLSISSVFKVVGSALQLIFNADGGVFSGGKWHPVTQYAVGGLPSQGEMFIARENGPELVGRLGGSTAVMNNNQIVSSVAAGVYQAVAAAMSSANSNQNVNVYATLYTEDNEVLARAVTKGQNAIDRRYNTVKMA